MISIKKDPLNPIRKRIGVFFETPISSFVVRKDGKIFYERKEKDPRKYWEFNINTHGNFIITPSPKETKELKFQKWQNLPFEKKYDMTEENVGKKFRMIYIPDWKSPASINMRRRMIVYNTVFKNAPSYVQQTIIGHEFGHMFTKSEHQADIYAVNWVMNSGGNLSTCFKTLNEFLHRSETNINRLKNFIKALKHGYKV